MLIKILKLKLAIRHKYVIRHIYSIVILLSLVLSISIIYPKDVSCIAAYYVQIFGNVFLMIACYCFDDMNDFFRSALLLSRKYNMDIWDYVYDLDILLI
jgi:hypothetical protein